MIELLEFPQRSKRWFELRQNKVSGTGAYTLLTKGLEQALLANSKHIADNRYMKRGRYLEDHAIEIYEAINDVQVLKIGLVLNSKYPNACFSPDGIDGKILLEVKCFNIDKHKSINTVNDIPVEVVAQIQFGLMLLELKTARLKLYNPDIENLNEAYKIIELTANKDIHANFKAKLKETV